MALWLGEEFAAFHHSLEGKSLSGLRLNPAKTGPGELTGFGFTLRPLPWAADEGFLLAGPADAGRHPFHVAGLYYLQEPDAMAVVPLLDPRPDEWVLDLCAAPGGKATHLASRLAGAGFLLTNDIVPARARILAANLERWGATCAAVTAEAPDRLLAHFGPAFHGVLVDAPCSGEGMFRKSGEARLAWSEAHVLGCAARQLAILEAAAGLVRPGGRLVYSTCTFAPEENEGVVGQFLRRHPAFRLVPSPSAEGFSPGRPEWLKDPELARADVLRGCVRLWPHHTTAEGHFVAIMVRDETGLAPSPPASWRPSPPGKQALAAWEAFGQEVLVRPLEGMLHQGGQDLYLLPPTLPELRGLRLVRAGLCLGRVGQGAFQPAHALALALRPAQVRQRLDLALNDERLAAYLRGGRLEASGPDGWVLVCGAGHPLGWAKRAKGRAKSHLPPARGIRSTLVQTQREGSISPYTAPRSR